LVNVEMYDGVVLLRAESAISIHDASLPVNDHKIQSK